MRTADQAARAAEVADLNEQIDRLRRKLTVLEDSKETELAKQKELLRAQQEQLMAQLQSKQAELVSKQAELVEGERETGETSVDGAHEQAETGQAPTVEEQTLKDEV